MTRKRGLIEGVVTLAILIAVFGLLGSVMGPQNLINTLTRSAHDLLINTVFYLMAITVIVGALSAVMIEFGVVRIIERITAPFMKPLFGLPGVASLAGVLTFLSDNPAILSLARDKGYASYFKQHQLYSLTNFGTAFGMGLIVTTYMMGLGFYTESLIGLLGTVIGAIVSTRLMQRSIKKRIGVVEVVPPLAKATFDEDEVIKPKNENLVVRFLNAILDGGKTGVDSGLAIIPGVLVISSAVMLLTWGPKDAAIGYQGLAYEGVPVLPAVGRFLAPLFDFLFGFKSPEAIAFPITSLGAVGAALGLVPRFLEHGLVSGNDIAVFTAIGMCWSGYLSTHAGMMDALGRREFIGKAIGAHTLGGLAAGISAHYLFVLAGLVGLV